MIDAINALAEASIPAADKDLRTSTFSKVDTDFYGFKSVGVEELCTLNEEAVAGAV